MAKGSMHVVLGGEKNITKKVDAILAETERSFKTKVQELYLGKQRTYTPFSAEDREIPADDSSKNIPDSVYNKLVYTFRHLKEKLDIIFTRDTGNQRAVGDLVVDGKSFGTEIPVLSLMTLEAQFTRVRNLIDAAPTLSESHTWVLDADRGPGFRKLAEPIKQVRTAKEKVSIRLGNGTDKFQEQVLREDTVVPKGEFTEIIFEGRLTPYEKSMMLEATDRVIVAIQKSIRQANDIIIEERAIGGPLLDFILQASGVVVPTKK